LIARSKPYRSRLKRSPTFIQGVVNVGSDIDEQGRIFTIADISINVVLKSALTSQINSIKYLGGTVGNLGLTVDMQWPAGDYALPTAFDQQFGQELIIFVNSDNNVLSYIENPFVSSIRYSLLSQGVQPTTAVTEAQGYAFNWNASSLRGQTVARALYHVVYNTSSNWKARANVTEPVARYSPTDDGETECFHEWHITIAGNFGSGSFRLCHTGYYIGHERSDLGHDGR